MSTDRDTTRTVRSWLKADDYESADRVLDAVLDQLDTTPQRRSTWWPARRLPHMNTTAKLALSAAAVVVVALLGLNFLAPDGLNIGSEGATPLPTATPEPQALITGSRGPGTFITDFYSEAEIANPVALTFEMPTGWEGVQPWVISGEGTMVFVQVSGLYSDPCLANSGTPDVPIGSTADELAAALIAHQAYEATETGTFTIDGHDGIRVHVETPPDLDYSTCQEESFWLWDGPLFAGAPSQFEIWIFDLDGTTAVVLAEGTDVPAQARSEMEQIVESINIQP